MPSSGLLTRVISAAILMPIALLAIWLGYPWIVLLVAAAAGAMVWEWCTMIAENPAARRAWLGSAVAAATILTAGLVTPLAGIEVMLFGTALAAILVKRWLWLSLGFIWILLPSIALVWLRGIPIIGFKLIIWLMLIVWAVDIAAYAFGRGLGGPKLAPGISPNKTWAGLLGGVAGAIVVGSLMAWSLGFHDRVAFLVASIALAVIEQMGDLAESYVKRRFGVKDSGTLIPGHGGILDRLDGMLAATGALAVMELAGWHWN